MTLSTDEVGVEDPIAEMEEPDIHNHYPNCPAVNLKSRRKSLLPPPANPNRLRCPQHD
jgi:hypothetical protein